MAVSGRVVFVAGIPFTAVAKELADYLEGAVGEGTVYSVQIKTRGLNWMSKGYGFVEFVDEEAACKAYMLAKQCLLVFQSCRLKVDAARRAVKTSAMHELTKMQNVHLSMGYLAAEDAFHASWSTSNVSTEFDHVARKLSFLFLQEGTHYKMELHYKCISEIHKCTLVGTSFTSLVLKLYNPPQVYLRREAAAGDSTDLPQQTILSIMVDRFRFCKDDEELPWIRTTDFTGNRSIGQSLVYCLGLRDVSKDSINTFVKQLENVGLMSDPPNVAKIKLLTGYSYSSSQDLVPLLCSFDVNSLPFEVVFQLNYLVQVGILNQADISPQFCELLAPCHTPSEHVNLILRKFARAAGTIYNPMALLKSKLGNFRKSKRTFKSAVIKLDDGQMLAHRLLVTPTKVYCMGPEIDVSNRVTRHFSSEVDNFLRISFVEEDWDRIVSTMLSAPVSGRNTDTSAVYQRILKVLQNGVNLGGKKFEFLAFSASQLRENSVWMFASNQRVTAHSIRAWMGDFLSIRNVAKCAARMGQSFSSSTHTINVLSHDVCRIPDIETQCGSIKYCFSDGIGKISKAFAMEVAAKCGGIRRLKCRIPSAFQIRYGGYKGVVAVDPSSFAKLSLRPSMCKFPSTHTGLDVLSWTHFIPCYLNRQVINLLSTLGVNDQAFERKQRDVVEHLDGMLHDPVAALEVLEMAFAGERHRTMVQMLHSGYHPQYEPYLNSLLQVFRASQLLMLRTKSRILVPNGRCLMGCLDETGVLGYGEVFVQVSPTPGTHLVLKDGLPSPRDGCGVTRQESACLVQGHVIVAKNPCLHPGDVRILKAVDVPSLWHMVDCVVFPQRGPRPHPNECSGSDLDGDLYFVSWDKELIPPSTDPPMAYNPPPAIQLDHSVTIEEIEEFFLNHMINDSLGLIANAHTVHADVEPEKARHPKCIELAQLFSVAVDFPKTGIPALVPVNLRPKVYPDFMEKKDKTSYTSTTVLGKLFRSIKIAAEAELPIVLFSEKDVCNAYDKHLLVEGFEQFVDEAFMHKSWYDAKLTSLMNQYGIQQEAELLSGNILHLSRYYCKRQGDVKERIQHAVNALQNEARNWFEDGTQDQAYTDQEENAKASAWYQVTYHPHFRNFFQKEFQEDELNVNFLSFPWVLYDKLLAIRKKSMEAQVIS